MRQQAGFFEIQLATGENAVTRDGEFRVSPDGLLVNNAGNPIMGTAGEIRIDPNNPAEITITYDGQIRHGALAVGQLRIVDVDNPSGLQPIGPRPPYAGAFKRNERRQTNRNHRKLSHKEWAKMWGPTKLEWAPDDNTRFVETSSRPDARS